MTARYYDLLFNNVSNSMHIDILDFSIYIHTVVLSLVEVRIKHLPNLIRFSVYYSNKYYGKS